MQDIQRYARILYKIPGGGGATLPSPAPRHHGQDWHRRLGAGLGGAAPPPGILYILVYLCTSWIDLSDFNLSESCFPFFVREFYNVIQFLHDF